MGGATNRVLTLLSFSSSSTTTTHFATFPLLLRLPFLSKLSFLPPPLFLSHRRFFSSSSFPCFSLHASHHFHSQTPLKLENFSKPSSSSSPSFRSSSPHHPWPEWYRLVESLFSAGYFNRNLGFDTDNEFVESAALPQDFANAVSACLAFAREKPGLLRLLSRRDMEVAIEHGTPFLFRNSDDSVTRLRSFLSSGNMNVLDTDKAHTVDLMRFILSYASNPLLSSESNNFYNKELVESSIRNLLSELAKLCYSVPDLKSFGSVQRPITEGNGQMERSIGHNIEMKRGDWICPRCSFMNFARNMKCLECEEARPKRQLTGGEWECPQCDFFNYGRNVTCLRCDCKRPGDVSIATTTSNKVETDSRLAANEEEVQKWFSKVSQLDNNSDLNAAADNENFPEILRKGVNRIEANTRRTPLERQLENAQYQRKLGNNASAAGPKVDLSDPSCIPSSVFPQHVQSIEGNSNYAPFVPLPADMFAKKPENSKTGESENKLSENGYYLPSNTTKCTGDASGSNETGNARISGKPLNQSESSNKQKEEAEKSERWFKRVAELHNVTDFANAIPDEDFPDIMPMRKGENRFVVSKKKDRSLTSPTYKRRMAVEQASNNNYVPFVPFPPDYFSKKNKPQPDEADLANKTAGDMNSNDKMAVKLPEKFGNANAEIPYKDPAPQMENQQVIPGRRRNWEASLETQNGSKAGAVSGLSTSGNLSQNFGEPQNNDMSRSSTGHFSQETPNKRINLTENSPQQSKSQNVEKSWTGRSLEGSAVKPPPDPKDMSEEAKAERWFRRVAQIKDISELSQIPDEDFPSIMPMRKGVNRFVVSKRKTPLERRLTSPQYRRNLPIVSSDPVKEENEDN